jgi:hypothetical protein
MPLTSIAIITFSILFVFFVVLTKEHINLGENDNPLEDKSELTAVHKSAIFFGLSIMGLCLYSMS